MSRKFYLSPEHLKLLKHCCIDWDDCEFGAPAIDCKRPYGNSGVYPDMLGILGVKELRPGVYEFSLNNKTWLLKGEAKDDIYLDGKDEESLLDALGELHRGTEFALQICLSTQSFKPGWYEEQDYGRWELIAEKL